MSTSDGVKTAGPGKVGKVYLVTGANVGLGKETVRQIACWKDTSKIYLACRSSDKALKVIDELNGDLDLPNGRLAFWHFDASSSREEIVRSLPTHKVDDHAPIRFDGIVLNAGGWGNDGSLQPTKPNNVLSVIQVNLIGHLHLLKALEDTSMLRDNCRIIYSGSEGARGIYDGIVVPGASFRSDPSAVQQQLVSARSIIDSYCTAKGLAALYFAAYARRHPNRHVLTVSPGGTLGTAIFEHTGAPLVIRIFPAIIKTIAYFLGLLHSVEVGAKRYTDALAGKWDDLYPSGTFVASTWLISGRLSDQSIKYKEYGDRELQEVVYDVMQKYNQK